jgi:thiamine biosynthesis lipoprotein
MNEVRRCQPLLGTFVEITVRAEDAAAVERGVADAFAAISKVQQAMSYHDPLSELSRLNQKAAAAPVQVSPWTFDVLTLAQQLAEESGGAFDITIASRLAAWGYLPRFRRSLGGEMRATWRDIELSPGRLVRFRRPLRVDLGGIAKGFAVDRAVDALRAVGVTAALVNAGGDLRAFGPEPWPVAIRHPARPGEIARTITIENAAIATSAAYFTRKKWRGCDVCPLVDGVTRRPCDDRLSVTVHAPSAVLADALCKIVAARRESAAALLASHGASALILDKRSECSFIAQPVAASPPQRRRGLQPPANERSEAEGAAREPHSAPAARQNP